MPILLVLKPIGIRPRWFKTDLSKSPKLINWKQITQQLKINSKLQDSYAALEKKQRRCFTKQHEENRDLLEQLDEKEKISIRTRAIE
jgi:hypothetical protein